MAVSPARILVVDGAEAALEDRFDVLADLSESALSIGIGLVYCAFRRCWTSDRGSLQKHAGPRFPCRD